MGRRNDAGAYRTTLANGDIQLISQSFITFMDALKLRMRAKDQLHPLLQDLVTGYARFKGSKDWEGRSKMVGWYNIRSLFRSLGLTTVVLGSLRSTG